MPMFVEDGPSSSGGRYICRAMPMLGDDGPCSSSGVLACQGTVVWHSGHSVAGTGVKQGVAVAWYCEFV